MAQAISKKSWATFFGQNEESCLISMKNMDHQWSQIRPLSVCAQLWVVGSRAKLSKNYECSKFNSYEISFNFT